MKRLQRKCLIASAVTHGLLLVMLLVGSAFVPHRRPPDDAISIQLVDIPDLLVDEPNMVGGGNPKAGLPDPVPAPVPQLPVVPAPQPVQPQPQPAPVPAPVQPQPEDAKPEKTADEKPLPPKPEPSPFNFAEAKTVKPATPKPSSPAPSFDFGKAERKTIKPTASSSRASGSATAEASAAAAREAQIASAMGAARARMQQGLSTGVGEIGIPGPGGAAYASYGLAIKKIYYDAWIAPTAAGDNEPTVEVEVVIARDGTVLSKRITKRSGKRELDRTVGEAIDRVKKTRPFPSGSTDEKRTFKIHFNLNSKTSIG